MEFTREIQDALNAAFPEDEVEFLPRAHSNGKALGLAYIDARSVMRRLDAVVGAGNWSFDFDVLSPDGKMVRGKLTVCGVTKCDAGEANTEDELLKSAVSDALKRTAVHFGVGRYLYYLPRTWAPYDSQRRTWAEQPRLAPQAVEKALAMCGVTSRGVTSNGGSASRATGMMRPSIVNGGHGNGQHREASAARPMMRESAVRGSPLAEARPETIASTADESHSGEKKSPWATGARSEATRTESSPESSGDRAAARASANSATPAPTMAPTPASANASRDVASLLCSTGICGKPLTKGQHDMSVRAFGDPLCPACQKERARNAA